MSEDNKKYIYINKESKLSPKVESIIDGLNFIVVESYEDLPADKSEKYIILDNLTSEIPKGCKTILVTEDSKLIDSKIADAVIDSEHLSTSLGAHVFSRFLGVNSSLSLEKIFTEKLSEVGVIKITSFGDFGYYSDIIYNFAIKHNVDGVIARTYFIELGNLLENLSSNHLELLPIEIDYGVVDKQLFIQAQANDLSGLMPILSDSNFSDVTTCLKKTNLFDIYSIESNQKIVFSAIWIPGDKLGSSLLFKDRFDFDYITDLVDSKGVDYLESKHDDIKIGGSDIFDNLIHRVKGMSAEDVSELVFGSDNESESVQVVNGEFDDIGEDVTLVEGDPEDIDNSQTKIENVTEHIVEENNLVTNDNVQDVKTQWNNKLGEDIETDLKKNDIQSSLQIEKLENMLKKKDAHTSAMKRIMGDMQSKMIDMGKKLKESQSQNSENKNLNSNVVVDKTQTITTDEKSAGSQLDSLKDQNKELLNKMHTFIMDKTDLEKKLKSSELKLQGLRTVEDVQNAKDEGLQKVAEVKRELHQKDGEIRAIDASRKEAQALAHTSELKTKQISHSLKIAREQFEKLKKKVNKSNSSSSSVPAGNTQSNAQVKQIQLKHDKLQKENKKHQSDLILKKKQVIDMKKENTLMKNEVEQIKRKLMKYEKKAA